MKFGCRSCGCDTLKGKRHWQLDTLAFVVRLVLLSVVVAAAPRTTLGEEANESPEITPADVFAGVASVRAEVELLRHYMGKPRNEQPELGVKGAAPREVYFQALTLFVKADRFCFEQTRQRTPQVESPAGEPQPEDVRRVVDVVLDCVRQVKKHYDVELKAATIEVEPGKTPTDVFRSIVQANRQVNLLLDERFAPSDVFKQVTLAVGYTAQLLKPYPGAELIPEEPVFDPGKTPGDVYRRLLGCFENLREIAAASGSAGRHGPEKSNLPWPSWRA